MLSVDDDIDYNKEGEFEDDEHCQKVLAEADVLHSARSFPRRPQPSIVVLDSHTVTVNHRHV